MAHTITLHKPDVKIMWIVIDRAICIWHSLYVACDGKLCVIGFFSAKLTISVATL